MTRQMSNLSLADQRVHHSLQNGSRKHGERYIFHKNAANDYGTMSKGKGVQR
jgi:hypothetical protein